MTKLSVDQALSKAKSYTKKGEIEEAKKLYQSVLQAFPKNGRAQKGLDALNKPKQLNATQSPPQETINQLITTPSDINIIYACARRSSKAYALEV